MRQTTTQETHPWKAMIRTAFQMLVGLAAIIPLIADDLGASALAVVGVSAAVTRVMAMPQVEAFLEAHVPFLAASSDR